MAKNTRYKSTIRTVPKRPEKPSLKQRIDGYPRELIVGGAALLFFVGGYFFLHNQNTPNSQTGPFVTPTTSVTTVPSVTPPPSTKTPPNTISPTVTTLPNTSGQPFSYTVTGEDTLYSLGKTFCGTEEAWADIAEANDLDFPFKIHTGDVLTIACN